MPGSVPPSHLIALPPSAPRIHGAFARSWASAVVRMCGWRVVGELPNLERVVLIAAPHTSGWDAVWGLLIKLALGLRVEIMAKQEIFWWPLGAALRWLGAFPVARGSTLGLVEQFTVRMRESQTMWLVLAPEGTRRKVDKWKSGFWRVAHDAGVPILAVSFHYPDKTITMGRVFHTSDDMDADLAQIREYYRAFAGKHATRA